MNIKIDTQFHNFQGPSSNYYNAMDRFEDILKYKMNGLDIPQIETQTNENPVIFGSNDYSSNNQSPIFENDSLNTYNTELSTNNLAAASPYANVFGNSHISSFDTNDIRKKSNVTAAQIDEKLQGTPLNGLGSYFKRAEEIYGVNALILTAIAKLESGNGNSAIARDKNNLFGFGAYDRSPYESAKSYATKQDSIYDVAKHLSTNYLRAGGMYFNGYSLDGVNVRYSTNKNWANSVSRIANELVN
ncbi:endo-beta-N-acetylglucosaminidase [Criibacterium bergeronii]|uniref:Endo-beta-N-acetylglucosaminidase n=1 Tax=Criibacterium bergeronii TaxID=1871336 RepID=A0A552V8S8_9FIRM|nr:glucosaminidase domain-containing protein [Criibacterium bergeronii]TRW26873.1 endo-beta-N-acetylglucosaminidase [Criibacterium bergeronii]